MTEFICVAVIVVVFILATNTDFFDNLFKTRR